MPGHWLVVLRPGAMFASRPGGMFVRTATGEYQIHSTALVDAWPKLQCLLQDGVLETLLPPELTAILMQTGAVTRVRAQLAESAVPWHRYSLAWAADSEQSVDRIEAGVWSVLGGPVETATVERTLTTWGLPQPQVSLSHNSSCRITWTGEETVAVQVVELGQALQVVRCHATSAAKAVHTAAPGRSLAAGGATLALLAVASGTHGWSPPTLPLFVDVDQHILRAAGGWSSQ